MPYYTGPDKYFVSNGNWAAFMQWLHEIREELVMLPNPSAHVQYEADILQNFLIYREASQQARNLTDQNISEYTEQILQNYSILRGIAEQGANLTNQNIHEMVNKQYLKALQQSLLNRGSNVLHELVLLEQQRNTADISKKVSDLSKDEKRIVDKKIKDTIDTIEAASQTIKKDNTDSLQKGIAELVTSQQEEKGTIPEIMARVGADITKDISQFDRKELDANNPIPEGDRINGNTRSQFGPIQSQQYNATNFPEHGKETNLADSALTISETMGDAYEFEVVSGYRPKNSKDKPPIEYKGWIQKSTTKGAWDIDATKAFTLTRPHSAYANEILEKIEKAKYPGSYKFFIEKLHGRYSDGTPYKLNEIKSQKNVYDAKGQNLTNRMVFSAYIDNYNDGFTVNSTDYNFLGRAEPVPVYKSTTRDMTLEFTLLADYSSELMVGMEKLNQQLSKADKANEEEILKKIIDNTGFDWGLGQTTQPQLYNDGRIGGHIPGMYSDSPQGLWSKMTFLAQCMYPYYREDGKMKEQPMFRIRIADFYDCIVFPKGMQIQMTALGDTPQVDMNPSSLGNMPLGVKITLTGQIIHNYEPASNFYGFYNRIEFDRKTLDPVTGVDINLHKDKVQEGGKKQSPYQLNNTEHNTKDLDLNSIVSGNKSASKLEGLFGDFKDSFGDLTKVKGIDLSSAFSKAKLKKAMSSYLAINEVVDYLRIMQGLDPVGGVKSIVESLKKGDYATAFSKGKQLGTDTLTKFNQLKTEGKDLVASYENKFEEAKGKVTGAVGQVLENDIYKTAAKTANKNLNIKLPETMQDILDKTKKTS